MHLKQTSRGRGVVSVAGVWSLACGSGGAVPGHERGQVKYDGANDPPPFIVMEAWGEVCSGGSRVERSTRSWKECLW